MKSEGSLARSRRSIASARHSLAGGFFDDAVSMAYFAAFYAATEAIGSVGEERSKHSGTIAAFGRHVVREGGFDSSVAKLLKRLYQDRNRASYASIASASRSDAEESIADAERFVDAVQAWLER